MMGLKDHHKPAHGASTCPHGRSGSFMLMRRGSRSASRMNAEVTIAEQEAEGRREAGREPDREELGQCGAEGPLADDAAKDGDGILSHLHHGEIFARLLLYAQRMLGSLVAIVGHLAQAQAARGGQRNLRHREKGAEQNQQNNHRKALGHS
jgi:hypothetical protein